MTRRSVVTRLSAAFRFSAFEVEPLHLEHFDGAPLAVALTLELSQLCLGLRHRFRCIVANEEGEGIIVLELVEDVINCPAEDVLLVWQVRRQQHRQRRLRERLHLQLPMAVSDGRATCARATTPVSGREIKPPRTETVSSATKMLEKAIMKKSTPPNA